MRYRLLIALAVYLPFIGNSAARYDYFQPMFQNEYQAMEVYVINQKYFASREILPSDFNNISSVIEPLKIRNVVSYEDMLKLMPMNVAPTTNELTIANALLDNAVRMYVSSAAAQSLSVVQTVNKVEKAMKTDMLEAKSDSGITHKVNVNFDVLQGATKLTYSGFFDGNASYKTTTGELYIVISKDTKIGKISYNHVENAVEVKDIVSLAYNF